MRNPMTIPLALALAAAGAGVALFASPTGPSGKKYAPKIAAASDEGRLALKGFRIPKPLVGTLWAAEPLLANPVSFCFDERGRCFVAETYRLHHGVTDNRGHMDWLDDDLASRTVADRVAMYRKFAKGKMEEYETDHDRVVMVEDAKGAGHADKTTVFADGFHNAADGLGSGVLARKGNVYYTCIPDLWMLRDNAGTGHADVKQSLGTGFGVHVAFLGHDMHGLRMGPDGRLYFSIGDRGLNVTTKEGKHLFNPDSGAVMRCEPDGSNLELFATGLRNPQELAFDEFGNLFTVDNNSDSGDRARFVYVVEGGDSGWRTGYQYGSRLSDRGPFNAEKIWHTAHPGQPAYIVPPLAHIADGPSGFCYNPGAVALPAKYADHFFLADFRGGAGQSGIRSFAVKPKGAAFELKDSEEFIWSILATDCDFGPDGGFYVIDWVNGWEQTGKGRIYRFADPEAEKNPALAEVKKLLAEGFDKRPLDELVHLLGYVDARVRQEAQFALAEKGPEAVPALVKTVQAGSDRLARLHAIWALGQLGRDKRGSADKGSLIQLFVGLQKDKDAEVRAQAVKTLGEVGGRATDAAAFLADADPHVLLNACLTLGKANPPSADGPNPTFAKVCELIRTNGDHDPTLRHAEIVALANNPAAEIAKLETDASPAVRLAAVVALRRQASELVAAFLSDLDPLVVTEAARAIHDLPIPGALPQLAALLDQVKLPDFVLARALNARLRLGGARDATAVARVRGTSGRPGGHAGRGAGDLEGVGSSAAAGPGHRADAGSGRPGRGAGFGSVEASPRRPVHGAGRGAEGSGDDRGGAGRQGSRAGAGGSGSGRQGPGDGAGRGAARAGIAEGSALRRGVAGGPGRRRAAGADGRSGDAGQGAAGRGAAGPGKGADRRALVEKQGAFAALADEKAAGADKIVADWLDQLLAKKVPGEVVLDLVEAAAKRPGSNVKERLQKYEAMRGTNPVDRYRESLAGGDAEAGRRVFAKAELSCVRCHKVGTDGGEVGPNLTGIGMRQPRDYLLESIVEPNKQIAKGFETVVLLLNNGQSIIGVLKSEDKQELKIITAEGKPMTIPLNQIDERTTGKSAMPEDLITRLTKSELRDLVEYLASLKESPKEK